MFAVTGWINGKPLRNRPGLYDVKRAGLPKFVGVERLRWTGQGFVNTAGQHVWYSPAMGDQFRGLTALHKG